MAGENEILDMSLFDLIQEDLTTQQVTDIPPEKKEEKKEEDISISSIETTDDSENQEIVGEEGKNPEKEVKDKDPDSPANSDDVFKPLAEFLKEQGFFTSLDKEITNADELAEAFREEIKKNEFAQLNSYQKEYLEALSQGIPDEIIQGHIKTRTIFENITDEILDSDAEVRKQVIIQDRLASGWTEARAERDYKRIFDLGEELEESRIARDNLKLQEAEQYKESVEKSKQLKAEEEKAVQQQLANLKDAVFKEDSFLGSFKVTDGLKQKVYDTMNTVVDYTPNGLPRNKLMKHKDESPIDFETKLYYLYELTNGFSDISKFTAKATTSAAKKLTSAISNSTLIKSGGNMSIAQLDDDEGYVSPIVDV